MTDRKTLLDVVVTSIRDQIKDGSLENPWHEQWNAEIKMGEEWLDALEHWVTFERRSAARRMKYKAIDSLKWGAPIGRYTKPDQLHADGVSIKGWTSSMHQRPGGEYAALGGGKTLIGLRHKCAYCYVPAGTEMHRTF